MLCYVMLCYDDLQFLNFVVHTAWRKARDSDIWHQVTPDTGDQAMMLRTVSFGIRDVLWMLNLFFLQFKLQLIKFELNSNFIYVPDIKLREINLAHYSQHPA